MLTATLWKFPGYESVDNGYAGYNRYADGDSLEIPWL